MKLKEQYDAYIKQQKEIEKRPLGHCWINQESRYVPPFQLYGNVWYVGDSWVCVHLIDTGDGLLLLDSGNCANSAMLIHSIWEAGFRPQDVKWIIHSHGHVDHFGASVFMKKMFGTKLYISKPDGDMFASRPEFSLIQESSNFMDELFEPDGLIQDGDALTFGGTTIQFYLVPGHTEGCIACFFDITDGQEVKRAGYYGGFGFNTLQKDFLEEFGDPQYQMRKVYLASLAKVRNQKVDVFLGNHCINNKTLEKRAFMLEHPHEPNPFVDSEEWGRYLDEKRDELLAFMADPQNN